MLMTPYEILQDYQQAKDQKAQISILADLNMCSVSDIRELLELLGEHPPTPVPAASRYERYRLLYDRGCVDREIAGSVGVTVKAVQSWRWRHGLAANFRIVS